MPPCSSVSQCRAEARQVVRCCSTISRPSAAPATPEDDDPGDLADLISRPRHQTWESGAGRSAQDSAQAAPQEPPHPFAARPRSFDRKISDESPAPGPMPPPRPRAPRMRSGPSGHDSAQQPGDCGWAVEYGLHAAARKILRASGYSARQSCGARSPEPWSTSTASCPPITSSRWPRPSSCASPASEA